MSDSKRGVSRRQFLGTAAAAAVAAGATPAVTVVSAQVVASGRTAPDQTLVLTNGRIHTMDARNTMANTVSIRNGRFVAVGGRAPGAGPTKVIDLKGRTVVPGLVEPHVHSVSLA